MNCRVSELALAIGARHLGPDAVLSGAVIDSRAVEHGALFFALSGDKTDGHQFVDAAVRAGASAVVVAAPQPVDGAQLVVADPEAALRATGAYMRDHFAGSVIGVTGSNGKTTVKQLLAAVMAEAGTVHATCGNLNNELGVPLTLAGLDDQACAVIEMAAAGPGDIAELGRIVRPDVAIVTNAGRAHLARFDSLDAVADTKGAIYDDLVADGIAVINRDDAYARTWIDRVGSRRCVTFAVNDESADIVARDIAIDSAGTRFELVTPSGCATIRLPLTGRHNIANALAAAAAAESLGVSVDQIRSGLAVAESVSGRLRILGGCLGGAVIADDSYNANPDSLNSALAWLAEQPGLRWLVLGDMAELGADENRLHAEAGEAAARFDIDHVWTVGELSEWASSAFAGASAHYQQVDALIDALAAALVNHETAPTVLIKGSRSAGMERVVRAVADDSQCEVVSC